MARKTRKEPGLAPRGDLMGMAAIRIWATQLETEMVKRYIGNAPTLDEIRKITAEAMRKLKGIKPLLSSDCGTWDHDPDCHCGPPPI